MCIDMCKDVHRHVYLGDTPRRQHRRRACASACVWTRVDTAIPKPMDMSTRQYTTMHNGSDEGRQPIARGSDEGRQPIARGSEEGRQPIARGSNERSPVEDSSPPQPSACLRTCPRTCPRACLRARECACQREARENSQDYILMADYSYGQREARENPQDYILVADYSYGQREARENPQDSSAAATSGRRTAGLQDG